jgi:hypothetical protein
MAVGRGGAMKSTVCRGSLRGGRRVPVKASAALAALLAFPCAGVRAVAVGARRLESRSDLHRTARAKRRPKRGVHPEVHPGKRDFEGLRRPYADSRPQDLRLTPTLRDSRGLRGSRRFLLENRRAQALTGSNPVPSAHIPQSLPLQRVSSPTFPWEAHYDVSDLTKRSPS